VSERIDALTAYLAEHGEQARHHEAERSTAMLAGMGFAGAIAALAGGADTPQSRLAAGLSILFVGLFGLIFSLKSYERNRYHVKMIEYCRKQIDAELRSAVVLDSSEGCLGTIRKNAEEEHYNTFKLFGPDENLPRTRAKSWIARQRVNRLWLFAWSIIILGALAISISSGFVK
jgi:hypothetical protein